MLRPRVGILLSDRDLVVGVPGLLLTAHALKAIAAIDWLVRFWQERHLGRAAAIGADRWIELARS